MIKPLGKILVEQGFITNMQLSEALIKQKTGDGSKLMGDIFLEMGILTREQLETALKKQQEPAVLPVPKRTPDSSTRTAHIESILSPHHTQQPISQFRHSSSNHPYPASQESQSTPYGAGSKELMALAQLLIKKGVITMEEYLREIQGR